MAAVAPAASYTIQISAELYSEVREFLSQTGKADSEAVSRFVDSAVATLLLRKSTARLHAATAHIDEEDLQDMIRESVDWARAQK